MISIPYILRFNNIYKIFLISIPLWRALALCDNFEICKSLLYSKIICILYGIYNFIKSINIWHSNEALVFSPEMVIWFIVWNSGRFFQKNILYILNIAYHNMNEKFIINSQKAVITNFLSSKCQMKTNLYIRLRWIDTCKENSEKVSITILLCEEIEKRKICAKNYRVKLSRICIVVACVVAKRKLLVLHYTK